ncbi:MAG: c-type cytochrome [Pirellulales bacterium]
MRLGQGWLAMLMTAAVVWLLSPVSHGLAQAAEPGEKLSRDRGSVEFSAWLKTQSEAAQRGYRFLTEKSYLPADLDDDVRQELEKRFLESHVGAGSPEVLRHYGLTVRPSDLLDRPLQYVVDEQRRWVMNCFACHGGTVYGQTYPGAPNSEYQLQTLTEDVRAAKLRLGKPLGHMDLGSMFMPLGNTVGTTNAVMFGVALMNYRDEDLNVHTLRSAPRMVHHDMDPPAWWLFHRKRRIYIDGFAEKGARGLMQFMLVRENGPDKFREWEPDFEDVYAFIESLRPPKYPFAIDAPLAERGRVVFEANCSRCHGSYGAESRYPEKLIDIDEIGTDRVRLDSLTPSHRSGYGRSWFAYYGKQETWSDPAGYMAPPLDGVWASAPYLHNGSIPTLWHVLHPESRPKVWHRKDVACDQLKVGFQIDSFDELPSEAMKNNQVRRNYFDTTQFGKSNVGHDFAEVLTEDERAAVLEYLKTL